MRAAQARLRAGVDRLTKRRAQDHSLQTQIASVLIAAMMVAGMAGPGHAANERRLKLYFTHTKERIDIVYKRNGQYVPSALRKLNRFLRDWRADKSIKMDPRLFDLVWSVYQQMDTREPIHVVSAFRSPKTNNMLRRRGRGVAKNSQHTRGKAMDFFIPGVPIEEIRNAGLRMHVGGVGYYPTSGSPFVHLDTGSVRHWPRMSDRQLAKVFPRGDTTHVGKSGKRLARYDEALRRQQQVAKAEISPLGQQRNGGVFARMFNRDQRAEPIPTTGQNLTTSGSGPQVSELNIAAISSVIPKAKPLGTPTDLLGGATQIALLEAPQPRPIPEALIQLRTLAATEGASEPALGGSIRQVSSGRSVATAWSQFDDRRSADLSDLIAAGQTIPQPASAQQGQAPDVAQAVMAALAASRENAAGDESTSAAASIAASILAPGPDDAAAQPGAFDPGPSDDDRDLIGDTVLTAYAPTAPLPGSRPAFTAALGVETTDGGRNGTAEAPLTPSEELPVAELRVPAVAPRIRPDIQPQTRTVASLPQRGRAELPDLPPIGLVPDNLGTQEQIPSTLATRQTANVSGRIPAATAQSAHQQLALAVNSDRVLRKLTQQETTRSEGFVDMAMPNPYAMAGAFTIPASVVDNGFSRTNSTLRTDRFTGRAIVATRVARLTN